MKLKPWYDVVKPREDLREGKSQDTSEFAVHLDRVRDGTGRKDYTDPEQFFAKTFLSTNLLDLASQVVRRMSGETAHTSPVFNLATNFGGGKTHALTLLYHLAQHGPAAQNWLGVGQVLSKAQVKGVPKGRVAVFVGTEFDSIAGRGESGEPKRFTPWGEIAWQLGGPKGFAEVKEHDAKRIAPGGDVIRRIVPSNEPCLILMDEVMNYMSRFRREGHSQQLYDFMMNLSGSINERSVLVVSIPASELEMTADDTSDYNRLTKMLDRVGKAITMTAGAETAEIIRRRLFDWDTRALTSEGKVMLPDKARDACHEFARWVADQSLHLPGTIPPEHARAHFEECYPFHPSVLSVFERKWQSVPKFQQTRGVLRMLALWVSHAYTAAYKKAHPDPLISLGTAPLGDPIFRAAVFEQLGNRALEAAVTTDIIGRKGSHAGMLDDEATEAIQAENLHQKTATVVFFESNGGTTRDEATVPEIRLATGHPNLDLGNVETALDALVDKTYYLVVEKKNYKFTLKENLNKRFSDKRASVKTAAAEELVNQEIQKIFVARDGTERFFFPEKSLQVPDRPIITFVVVDLQHTMEDATKTTAWVEKMTKECGSSARTNKNALVWIIAESSHGMTEEARKLLAWEAIKDDASELRLDESQQRQLKENIEKSRRDLRDSVWQAFHHVLLLDSSNSLQSVDLGAIRSSASAGGPLDVVVNQLTSLNLFDKGFSPRLLLRNWPGAMEEWSTKGLFSAIYASPLFPRIINGESAVQQTVSKAVSTGELAYVSKRSDGVYAPFIFGESLHPGDVEISDDYYVIKRETAEAYKAKQAKPSLPPDTGGSGTTETVTETTDSTAETQEDQPTSETQSETQSQVEWHGEVPPQKWMNFYTRFVSKFTPIQGVRLEVTFKASPDGGISPQKLAEAKAALRELGLDPDKLQ